MDTTKKISLFSIPVLVAALGYFVDIYDLLLFLIVREKSLASLGLGKEEITNIGLSINNYQMVGLLLGGIIWGVMGDRKGRLSVLFGSILLYSLANTMNGFVTNATQYSWCRFVAGIGLAGELGAGITLVSELLTKEQRGIATSFIAAIGLSGAVAAYFISEALGDSWRICFFIGGGLGLCLLLMRIAVFESGMFHAMKSKNVSRGNFLMFFTNAKRFKKYILSILIGMPTWYVIGILVGLSNKFAEEFHIDGPVRSGKAIMYAYAAISIGDLLTGFLCHVLKSRKKALFIYYGLTAIAMYGYFNQEGGTAANMYWLCAFLGFGTGFWAIFVVMAAEQFGTNLRSTAATTIPNMVRGSLPLITMLFKGLQPQLSFTHAAIWTGVVVMAITVIAAFFTEETFGKDLDYFEE